MNHKALPRVFARALPCAALLLALGVRAEVPIETTGRVATLPLPHGRHWIFVGDALGHRTSVVVLDDGRMLGTLDNGFGIPQTLHPGSRSEIYVVETHYSRGSRGERTDVLTGYDAATLVPSFEVVIPPKRAISATLVAHTALSDDDRFAYVFNLTPATSVSIVDLVERRFVEEVTTPGCSLVYPVDDRRFAMLCMDGAMLVLRVDDAGHVVDKVRSAIFFDSEADPVTEKAVRWQGRWLFPSFEGWIHPVAFDERGPVFEERWSLVSDAERADDWRIGGYQQLAVHAGSSRMFALMHQGGPDTHKHPGTEVWVYDLASRERIQRIELVNPGFTYLGVPIEGGDTWGWLVDWIGNRVMASVPELGIENIAVTQDDAPRLATSGQFSGGIAVYDALEGSFLGRVFSGNMTNVVIQAPRPAGSAP